MQTKKTQQSRVFIHIYAKDNLLHFTQANDQCLTWAKRKQK